MMTADCRYKVATVLFTTCLLSACASYRPHDGKEPQGYYHQQVDPHTLRVTYETWRPANREKVCALAKRRLTELAPHYQVIEESWSEKAEMARVDQAVVLTRAQGSRDFGSGTDIAAPSYTDYRLIRRCELLAKEGGGETSSAAQDSE